MNTYEITIPNLGTYRIDSETELNEQQVYQAVAPEAEKERQRLLAIPYSDIAEVADTMPSQEPVRLGTAGRKAVGLIKGAMIDPVEAAVQLFGGEEARKGVAEREKSYQQMRKELGEEGIEGARILGNILSPATMTGAGAGVKTAQLATKWSTLFGTKVAQGVAAGAGSTILLPVTTPQEEQDSFWLSKAKDIGFAGLAGGVVSKIGAALTPQLKEGAEELIAQGVKVAPGQAYGGVPGWVFRQMESIGFGPSEQAIRKSFTRVAADEVLSSIGKKLPKTVKDGMQASGYVQKQISQYYDDAFIKLGTVVPDNQFANDIGEAVANASREMSPKVAKAFNQEIKANIVNKFQLGPKPPSGAIVPQGMAEIPTTSGNKLKEIDRFLKKQIEKYGKGTDADSLARVAGYEDALNAFRAYVSRVDTTGLIAKADDAWAKLYRFADASQKAFREGGDFSAEQLAQAAVRQGSTLQAGAGQAPMQEFAQRAVEVIGKDKDVLPLGYRQAVIAGKIGTGAALSFFSPLVAGPILVASGMSYTAAQALMKNPSALRKAVEAAIQKIGPSTAAAIAAQSNNTPEEQVPTKASPTAGIVAP